MTLSKTTLIAGVLFVSCLSGIASYAQIDLTGRVRPVYEGVESTALSIFDTNSESPDGKYLCFIRYPAIVRGGHFGPVVKADVMIRNTRTGDTNKIHEIWTTNHNGGNAVWVDAAIVAFQVNHLKDFVVYDVVKNRLLFGPVDGELGHKSFGNTIYYTVCSSRLRSLDASRKPYEAADEGIYRLNVVTGKREQVATKKQIVQAFSAYDHKTTDECAAILHVEPNPKGDKLIFDFRYSDKEVRGFMKADGTDIRALPVRPMHCVWFDNDFLLGVYTADPEKKIYRFGLNGDRVELLGGLSTHVGGSPDRQWYIGESAYYGPDPDGYTRVYLYRRGNTTPVALLAEWTNSKITWDWVAHVNPSFSSDGERAYFIRAVDNEDAFEAVGIDLSEINQLTTGMYAK